MQGILSTSKVHLTMEKAARLLQPFILAIGGAVIGSLIGVLITNAAFQSKVTEQISANTAAIKTLSNKHDYTRDKTNSTENRVGILEENGRHLEKKIDGMADTVGKIYDWLVSGRQ